MQLCPTSVLRELFSFPYFSMDSTCFSQRLYLSLTFNSPFSSKHHHATQHYHNLKDPLANMHNNILLHLSRKYLSILRCMCCLNSHIFIQYTYRCFLNHQDDLKRPNQPPWISNGSAFSWTPLLIPPHVFPAAWFFILDPLQLRQKELQWLPAAAIGGTCAS